jgi:sugar-specific transcriptional regulator TrmB
MSKNLDLNIISDLQAFGVDEKAGRVYAELLSGGELSAISLSKRLELHRQFVYNALESLKEKGLVIKIEGVHAKWRAQHPRKLIALAEEQQLRASKVSDQLLALMEQKTGQEFEVGEGVASFRSRSIENVRKAPHDSTVLMISGQWNKYFELAGEHMHTEWERIRLGKNIRFRVIGPTSLRNAMNKEASGRLLTDYRIFPGLEESLVNTIIYDNQVDFDIYGEPHLTFSIKNPEVAKSQKDFFEAVWNKSENL